MLGKIEWVESGRKDVVAMDVNGADRGCGGWKRIGIIESEDR